MIIDGDNSVQPKNYQWAMYRFGRAHPRCAFFVDMGLGKTWPAASLIADEIFSFDTSIALVVGPKRVIEGTWPEELKKWPYLRGLKFLVLNGTEREIHKKLDLPGYDVHLVSYDRVHLILTKARYPRYGMAVIDESQKVRNQATRRWQAVELLTAPCRRVVLLTGTPSPNGLHQLWAQLKLLDGGARLGKTIGAFMNKWFSIDKLKNKINANKGTAEQINARIKGICFTLLAEDYQNLPPLVVNDVELSFSEKLQKQYDKFEEEAVLTLPGLEEKITAVNATALYSKLTQFSNGAIYDSEKKYHCVHDLKLDALEDIIDEAFGDNVLVIYQHKSDMDRVLKKFPGRAVHLKTQENIDAWKRGEIEIGLGHPESIGVGTNLQSGGRIMVWYGLTWNLENYLQTIKRLWRMGQDKPVIMHRLIVRGTVDEVISRAIKRKDRSQRTLMEAMKWEIIEPILKRAA